MNHRKDVAGVWLPTFVSRAHRSRSLGMYVHVPGCEIACVYCGLSNDVLLNRPAQVLNKFYAATLEEINFAGRALLTAGFSGLDLDSIYLGGGPSGPVGVDAVVGILERVREVFEIRRDAEVTVELRPENVDLAGLIGLKAAGMTRIVVDAQSADPGIIRALQRRNQFSNVSAIAEWANSAELELSIDLVYGFPGESLRSWGLSIEWALALRPDHISIYEFTGEPGSSLELTFPGGELKLANSDLQAEMYSLADQQLAEAGFEWYEVSHWARAQDSRSRHNLSYWTSQNWWGVGPGAHSHIGGVRWWNVSDVEEYAELVFEGKSPEKEREILDSIALETEKVMLGIRLRDGLDVSKIDRDKHRVLREWVSRGLIIEEELEFGRIVPTLQGRLLADFLARELS